MPGPRPLAWLLLTVAVVLLGNLAILFADVLWHDDALWYLRATADRVPSELRGRISLLTPYKDLFYSHGMVELGLPAMRALYALMIAGGAYLLARVQHGLFGVRWPLAWLGAVLAALLPSLQIPLSLNASYAVPTLLLGAGALWLLWRAGGARRTATRAAWLGLALLTYVVTLESGGTGVMFVPVMLLSVAVALWSRLRWMVPMLVLCLAAGTWRLVAYLEGGTRAPVRIGPAEMVDRAWEFLAMSSPLQLPLVLEAALVGLLGMAGLIAIWTRPELLVERKRAALPRFAGLAWGAWLLTWMGAHAVPYVAMSEVFRAYDYAFMFHFASVPLQLAGAWWLVDWARRGRPWRVAWAPLVTLLLFAAVVQKNVAVMGHPGISSQVKSIAFLREQLQRFELPAEAQIVIVGPDVMHPGQAAVNGGLLRYVTGREDLRGLVGDDHFPNDMLARPVNWFDRMKPLARGKPVLGFRQQGDRLVPVGYMLRTMVNPRADYPRYRWVLYRLGERGQVTPYARGFGIDAFFQLQRQQGISKDDVLFAPGPASDRILPAAALPTLGVDIDACIFEDLAPGLEVSAPRFDEVQDGLAMRVLLRIGPGFDPSRNFGYSFTGWANAVQVHSARYLRPGDYLLAVHPETHAGAPRAPTWFDMTAWPIRPISAPGRRGQALPESCVPPLREALSAD